MTCFPFVRFGVHDINIFIFACKLKVALIEGKAGSANDKVGGVWSRKRLTIRIVSWTDLIKAHSKPTRIYGWHNSQLSSKIARIARKRQLAFAEQKTDRKDQYDFWVVGYTGMHTRSVARTHETVHDQCVILPCQAHTPCKRSVARHICKQTRQSNECRTQLPT